MRGARVAPELDHGAGEVGASGVEQEEGDGQADRYRHPRQELKLRGERERYAEHGRRQDEAKERDRGYQPTEQDGGQGAAACPAGQDPAADGQASHHGGSDQEHDVAN